MYEDFFDLKTLPFKITPDPAFIYWDAAHTRAASILAFGIEQLVPITVVTGDVGTGKTTLLQHFLEDAPRETTVGMISNYWSGMGGLYQWILNAFDIHAEGTPVQLYRAFEDFVISEYASGRRCVLIVDEAQNVSDEDLEQLRMLTNINARKDCLLMLFLVGQPELRERLQQSNNRQIAQRVGAAFHLGPMSLEDTGHYIRHRISVAGGTREIFDSGAIEAVYRVSGGVPRLVNVVCELALVTGFGDGVDRIDAEYMEDFLIEAAESGLIAHLPHDPTPPLKGSKPRGLNPGPSGGAGPAGLRKSATLGNRKPSIRLVSEPGGAKAPVSPEPEPQAPAARIAEPSEIVVPEVTPEISSPEPEAGILSEDQALELLSPEPIEPQDQPDAVETTAAQPEQEQTLPSEADADEALVSALRHDAAAKPERAAFLSWLAPRMLDDGLNIVLVGLIVAGFYLSAYPPGDDAAAMPESGTTSQPENTTGAAPAPKSSTPQQNPTATASDADTTPQIDDTTPDAETHEIAETAAANNVVATDPAPIVPLDDPRGDMLLESALATGVSDPVAAAIAYSRAALRGEDRAAYYLGQLFETGVGVPRDVAAARAWYEHAQPNVRSAKRRLAVLDPPEDFGTLAAPILLLGGPLPGGAAEFVWAAGKGIDPKFYLVEIASARDEPVMRHGPSRLTAMSVANVDAARVWRVLAIDPVVGDYAVSNWRAMGKLSDATPMGTGPVRVQVQLQVAEGTGSEAVDSAYAALAAAGVSVSKDETPVSGETGTMVSYAYVADQAAAENVAALLGKGVQIVNVSLENSNGTLIEPGQLTVILNGS